MRYLLDTNVISEAKRPTPDENVLRWLRGKSLLSAHLSVITLGELEEGISLLGDTHRAQALRDWLVTLTASFAGRILSVDEAIVTTWGRIRAEAKRQGRPAPVLDALIAATAITHDLTLVTRNVKDVAALPVKILNPFEVSL